MKSITVALLLLCPAQLCLAELSTGSQTLSLQVGGGFSGSTYGNDFGGRANADEAIAKPGAAVGGQYFYFVHSAPAIGVGLDVNYSGLQQQQVESPSNDLTFRTRFQPTTVMAMGKLAFGQGRIHPYLFGGIGFYRTSLYIQMQPHGSTTWSDGSQDNRPIVDGTGSGFAGGGGIGVDVFLTPAIFIGAEGRFTYLGTSSYPLTEQAKQAGFTGSNPSGDLALLNLLVHLGVKFGAN